MSKGDSVEKKLLNSSKIDAAVTMVRPRNHLVRIGLNRAYSESMRPTKSKKLVFHREVIRELDKKQLEHVQGGAAKLCTGLDSGCQPQTYTCP
jgi:hypothetical protein